MNRDTLVVVHAYQGDAHQVEAFLPQFLHHGCPVLILSPEDSPVRIDHPNVECRSAGPRGYFGQESLDRQRAHLELLLEYDFRHYLLNDADSMCLSPEIPAYVYEGAEGTVWSNEVKEGRPHKSPYPKIAFHPPYFMTKDTIARLVAGPYVEAHPITPFIDYLMVVLTYEAGLAHRSYPDGRSLPAWRHTAIPETKLLGHDYVHVQENRGIDGAHQMRRYVGRGAVMIHSVKHPEVRDILVAEHARYAAAHPRKQRSAAKISALVAFRDSSPGQERRILWDYVREKFERELPSVEIVEAADDGTDPFWKTRAINEAARRATGEIFLLTDADTWVPPEQVYEAAQALAQAPGSWYRPWRLKVKLSQRHTAEVMAQGAGWDGKVTREAYQGAENRNGYFSSPPLMLHRDTFLDVGGMDERARGWGSEDDCFALALIAFHGRSVPVDGHAVHLWHPRIGRSGKDLWPGQESDRENRALAREYRAVFRNPEQMRRLIAERELAPTA